MATGWTSEETAVRFPANASDFYLLQSVQTG